MKVTVKYDELVQVLGFAGTVLSDKSVEDKMKNIIFQVSEGSLRVVGYNAFTFCRNEVEDVVTEDIPGNGWDFQVKYGGLTKILSSYSSLSRTAVEGIDFELDGVKVKMTVHEVAKDEADSRLSQNSVFNLENIPILSSVSKEIAMEYPEGSDVVESADLSLYIESLLPLMNNDSASKSDSKLNFADDYVFVMSAQMSSYIKNRLPDSFKNLTLSYSSISFLKKLTENTSHINICRLDKYLCIQSEKVEAFMKYQHIKIKYSAYLNKLDTTKGIVVDRVYLKEVLKRMSSVDPNGKMYITEDGILEVVNSGFSQPIVLNKVKEGTGGIAFNVSANFFEKAMIGRDELFSPEVFIYFVPSSRGYMVFMMDKTGVWLSNTSVTRA